MEKRILRTSLGSFVLLTILFFALDGCTAIKTLSLLKKGEVEQKDFLAEIPFELRQGLIVLKVEIGGEDYDFILDTGAPNAISTKITKKLNLSPKVAVDVGDSQDQEIEQDLVQIPKISIGGINFLNTAAVAIDMDNNLNKVSCLEADGLIGTNLMRNAVWKIDYQSNKIIITNAQSSIKIPGNAQKIPFTTNITGSPYIKMKLNDVELEKVEVDLGKRGDFTMTTEVFNKLLKGNSITKKASGTGLLSAGIFGYGKVAKDDFALINEVSFGSINLSQVSVVFSNKKQLLIGTNFLKNYTLIFNWSSKTLILEKEREYSNDKLETFGFEPIYQPNGDVTIGYIFDNSSAQNQGLRYGDLITELSGTDLKNIEKKKWCSVRETLDFENNKELSITIIRDGKEKSVILQKQNLLN